MPRQICLAQPATSGTKDDQARMFTIVERASIRLHVHDDIWRMLLAAGKKCLVIDDKHPEEAFSATITGTDVLDQPNLGQVIAQARKSVLDVEESSRASLLSKEFDSCFDAQREWLQLRVVLSQAVRGKNRSKRVLLLFC
jgi:hypothetical protein